MERTFPLALAVALALALTAPPAFSGPASTQKALSRRAEAQNLVDQIASGGNLQAAVSRLQFLGQEAFASAALADLLGRSVDDRQRRNMVSALSLLGSPAAERTLVALLTDSDGAIRMAAVQGLGRMKSRAVGAISPLLADKTLGVRKEAARALGAACDPKAARLLLSAARSEGEPEARAAMLVAVGACGDSKMAKALEPFLDSSSESTRFAAAQGLCQLGSPRGYAFARSLLASKEPLDRRQVLALFEGSTAKQSQVVLRPLLADPDLALAAGAARLLYLGGDPKALEWLVLASYRADGEQKLVYESQLESLRLADDQRRAILARAGVK
ncbi:MAG: HEAT repeat domain-containing protein [Myxococcaceae bacterium]